MRSVILAACSALLVGCTETQTPSAAPLVLTTTQQMLTAQCESGEFSGIVRVRNDNGQVFEFFCGEGVGTDSLFKAFSTSKQITAAVILTHVDAGRLSLDDTLADHVEAAPAAWSQVTVGQLLQHRSGLPDLTGALLGAYQDGARDHPAAMNVVLIEHEAEAPPPDPQWQYNNFGYELLTLVAESVSEDRFETQTAQLIFAPAGLNSARFERVDISADELTASNTDDLVQGYNGEPGSPDPARSYAFVQRGAGALHMSAHDMSAYLRAYRSGVLMSTETRALMTETPYPITDTVSMGLGWFIRDTDDGPFISHSGGTNGYVSLMGFTPNRGVEVVIASNYGFAQIGPIRDAILVDAGPDGTGQTVRE